jgi:hypothetical protein
VTAIKQRVVVLSDLHVGSTVGLWPGEHPIEGGGLYKANKYQQWLLECWQQMVDELAHMRPRPVVVLNGDEIQGVNMRDGQLITNKIDIQVEAALRLLEPVRRAARAMYLVRGTEWHVGKAAEHVETLGRLLNTKRDPGSGQWSWWELYLDLGGPVVQLAHHISAGSVPWYEATIPLRDTLMLLAELMRFVPERPNVRCVIRSHRHRFIAVHAPPDLHIAVTPAWQLRTAFVMKKAGTMLPQIGYVIVDWDGVDVMIKPRIYPLPGMHVEAV